MRFDMYHTVVVCSYDEFDMISAIFPTVTVVCDDMHIYTSEIDVLFITEHVDIDSDWFKQEVDIHTTVDTRKYVICDF